MRPTELRRRVRSIAGAGLLAGLAGCAAFTRPDGDGGWSTARRESELATAAARAQVALEPEPAVTPAPSGPLTLAEALVLAARGNRPIAVAGLRTDSAAYGVQDARGRLLPNVTGNGRYTWNTDPQSNSFTIPGTGLRNSITIRESEYGTVNGTATVPIDLWGELRHTLAAAQAGYRGERARAWATTLEQHLAVVRAYFGLLRSEQLRRVTDQSILFRRQQLANAQARTDAGRLTRNELLVVQVALESAEQERQQRDLAVDRARWTLNDTVGLPIDAPTVLADVASRPDLPTTDAALRTAYGANPALIALIEERQRLDETATALVRGRLPKLQGGGTVDWTSSDALEPQRMGGAFVGFTWDLGLDGRREAQIGQARLALDQNRLQLEQELRGIEGSVRATQRAVTERLNAATTAAAAVAQAEENVRIRQQQFDAGRATSEDVLDAEALLAGQRATLATARYDAHVHRAELQQLMGLPFDDVVPR